MYRIPVTLDMELAMFSPRLATKDAFLPAMRRGGKIHGEVTTPRFEKIVRGCY